MRRVSAFVLTVGCLMAAVPAIGQVNLSPELNRRASEPVPDQLDALPRDITDAIANIADQRADIRIRPAAGDYDRPAAFKVRPLATEAAAFYPVEALRQGGVDGRIRLGCLVTDVGAVQNCEVLSESPANRGFGPAARALSTQFQVTPAQRNGVPVASRVEFDVAFRGPGKPVESHIGRNVVLSQNRYVASIAWKNAPTYDQLIAVYPERAKAAREAGRAVLGCVFNAEGRLRSCDIQSESPAGMGFGEAAKRLMPLFGSNATLEDGSSIEGVGVTIPVAFRPAMLERRDEIGAATWRKAPSAATLSAIYPDEALDEDVLSGKTLLECVIGADGLFDTCNVVSEEPRGLGFGQAALTAASKFVAPIWTEEGVGSVGATVRLPVNFAYEGSTQAAR